MKIENGKPGPLTESTDPLGRTAEQRSTPTRAAASGATVDQITLSPEAQMIKAAAEAAAAPAAIRSELVDKMRALLVKGELGTDASALADAIVDDWLTWNGQRK